MKKSLILATAAILIAASSFASPATGPDNKKAAELFSKVFVNAKSVQWEENSKFLSATFQLHGTYLSAHFSPKAELIGVSRNITSTQLPLHLFAQLQKHYSNYWISELFEYATKEEDSYYITLENADQILILKGSNYGFSVYKKTSK